MAVLGDAFLTSEPRAEVDSGFNGEKGDVVWDFRMRKVSAWKWYE